MSFLQNLGGINYVPGPNTSAGIPNPGGTAQTSGFVEASDTNPTQQIGTSHSHGFIGDGFGGGLGSSPLVPIPGKTINPSTGKPHSEGMTREELQAKKAAEAAAITAQLSSTTSAELNDQVQIPQGGLGSSPLVPKPGTSINPETGKLHSEGLTREELQAKRASEAANSTSGILPISSVPVPGVVSEKPSELSQEEWKQIQEKGKELLDPTPHHQQARRSSSPKAPLSSLPPVSEDQTSASTSVPHATALTKDGRRLSDLSGREQAARQLAGTANAPVTGSGIGSGNSLNAPSYSRQDSGLITPGLELPGGWGSTKAIPFPGTGPNATTSIYDDVAEGLEKAGKAAFAVIPTPIKDAFSTSPTSPKATSTNQLSVSPPSGRRSSVTALFDQAKEKATKLVGDAQGSLQGTIPNIQRRASASLNPNSEFRNKLSDFVDNFAHPGMIAAGTGRPGSVGLMPRFSLPSEEPAGALPGEHTTGVGALPGSSNETGVAVLPEERKRSISKPTHENQGVLPGENSGGFGTYSSGLGSRTAPDASDVKANNIYTGLNSGASAGPSGTSSTEAPASSAGLSSTSASTDVIPLVSTHVEPATPISETPPSTGIKPSTTTDIPPTTSTDIAPSSTKEIEPTTKDISPSTSTAVAPTSDLPPTTSTNTGPSRTFGTSNFDESTPRKATSGSYGGLAAALPATFLGLGGDKGATDVPAALGKSSEPKSLTTAPGPTSTVESGSAPATSTLSPASVTGSGTTVESESTPATSTLSPSSASEPTSAVRNETSPATTYETSESSINASPLAVPETRHGTERTTSSASVIAIRDGFEGESFHKSSPLSGESIVPEHEETNTSSLETRHGNERTTSSASVTAIRHGYEGTGRKVSPLVGDLVGDENTVPEHEELDTTPSFIGQGQKSTTSGTGPNHTTSLTPGNEHEGIGHYSTRDLEGTSRKPESYPTPDHSGSIGAAGIAGVAAGSTTASHSKLDDEKRKAEALIDAPAQSSDLTNNTTSFATNEIPTSTNKVKTEPPANGPTQHHVSSSEKPADTTTPHHSTEKKDTPSHTFTSTPTSVSHEKSLPHPTSVADAERIAGIKHEHGQSTPNTPVTKTTTGSAPSSPNPASPIFKTSASTGNNGHSRKESGNSDKKRGLFGKIKDKLKH